LQGYLELPSNAEVVPATTPDISFVILLSWDTARTGQAQWLMSGIQDIDIVRQDWVRHMELMQSMQVCNVTLIQWAMYGLHWHSEQCIWIYMDLTKQELSLQAKADMHIINILVAYTHHTLIQERWLYTWIAEAWTADVMPWVCMFCYVAPISIAAHLPQYSLCQAKPHWTGSHFSFFSFFNIRVLWKKIPVGGLYT